MSRRSRLRFQRLADILIPPGCGLLLVLTVLDEGRESLSSGVCSPGSRWPSRRARSCAGGTAIPIAGLTLSLVVSLTVSALATVVLSFRDLPLADFGELLAQVARNAAVAAALGALGVCVGALVRNQLVAVMALLVLAFVAEPLLISLVPDVGRFGPLVALPNSMLELPPDATGTGEVELVAPGWAVAAMLAWIGAAFAAAAALLRRRDLE